MYFYGEQDDGITNGHEKRAVFITNLDIKARTCARPDPIKVQIIQNIIQASSEESFQRCAKQRQKMLINFTCFK